VVRQGNWTNKALARIVLEALGYNPSAQLHKVTCPVFLRVGLRDHLCPPSVVRAAAEKLRNGYVLHERDATHLGAHKVGAEPQELKPVIEFLWRQFDPKQKVHKAEEGALESDAGVEVHVAGA
jgi:pimeloyl-ACP methyl ester carboxylesterase